MAWELVRPGEIGMTIKEVAAILGVTGEAIKKHVRALYPSAIVNGKTTYLTEEMVTAIKKCMMPTTQVVGATTDMEMAEKAREVMVWLTAKVTDLEAKVAEAAPKVESFDALMVSDSCMSITDAAKHFGLHAKLTVFPYFREKCYLTKFNLPTQKAIDADFLTLRQCRGNDGEMHSQSVVRRCQLENWRTKVVPQVKEWAGI